MLRADGHADEEAARAPPSASSTATLDLFNRLGEPNVSTTLISAELGISPGNLYYHYPAKEELITKLFDRYDAALTELLRAADERRPTSRTRGCSSTCCSS